MGLIGLIGLMGLMGLIWLMRYPTTVYMSRVLRPKPS